MTRIVMAVLASVIVSGAAHAGPAEDYAVCLMDRSEIALDKGHSVKAALESAYEACPIPAGLPSTEIFATWDYAAEHLNRVVASLDGPDGTAPEPGL